MATNRQPTLTGTHPVEKVVGDRYTRRVFKKFRAKFIASNNCMHESLKKDTCGGRHRVGYVKMIGGNEKWFVTLGRWDTGKVQCHVRDARNLLC